MVVKRERFKYDLYVLLVYIGDGGKLSKTSRVLTVGIGIVALSPLVLLAEESDSTKFSNFTSLLEEKCKQYNNEPGFEFNETDKGKVSTFHFVDKETQIMYHFVTSDMAYAEASSDGSSKTGYMKDETLLKIKYARGYSVWISLTPQGNVNGLSLNPMIDIKNNMIVEAPTREEYNEEVAKKEAYKAIDAITQYLKNYKSDEDKSK